MSQYIELCPRGFANESSYILVQDHEVAQAEAHMEEIRQRLIEAGGSIKWTLDPRARKPNVAIDWADYITYY